MTAYATPQDVYDLGLSAPAFLLHPRALDTRKGEALDAATGTFRMVGHGLIATDEIEIVLIGTGAVPTGATVNTTYYPIPVDYFRFRLSATSGGSALTFSDTGSGGWAIQVNPERRITRNCEQMSREIDQDLVAHATPILPDATTGDYPDKLVGIVARCVARRMVAGITFDNPQFKAATERLIAEEKRDDEQRAAWRAGAPLLPTPLDQTSTPDDTMKAGNGSDIAAAGLDFAWVTGAM